MRNVLLFVLGLIVLCTAVSTAAFILTQVPLLMTQGLVAVLIALVVSALLVAVTFVLGRQFFVLLNKKENTNVPS